VLFDLLMLAFRRLLIVPMYALVQLRSAPAHRARVIAPTTSSMRCHGVGGWGRRPLLGQGLSIQRCSHAGRCSMRRWRSISTAGAGILLRFIAALVRRCFGCAPAGWSTST
jgi:hypothetical protein